MLGALKLWLRAEYDTREGLLTPDALRERLRDLAPLLDPAARAGGFRELPAGARILDAGCGSGLFLFGLLARAPHLQGTGVDLSPGAVEGAARAAEVLGVAAARFEVADLESLPFPDGAFDGAVCAFTLNLLPDKASGLRELARVLRPGARLVVLDSVIPGRAADAGSEDEAGFLEKAAAAGLLPLDRVDVTDAVRALCARATWPWAGAIREDARMTLVACERGSRL